MMHTCQGSSGQSEHTRANRPLPYNLGLGGVGPDSRDSGPPGECDKAMESLIAHYLSFYGACIHDHTRLQPQSHPTVVAVTNITREKLRVGIWSGNIVLSGLELRLVHSAPPIPGTN